VISYTNDDSFVNNISDVGLRLNKKTGMTKKNVQKKLREPRGKKRSKGLFGFIKKYFPTIIIIIFFIGILSYSTGVPFQFTKNCEDGTPNKHCSLNKPFYCSGEILIENASQCGCDNGYRVMGNICEELPTCVGGTLYDKCSTDKPFYCDNKGRLYNNVSKCGCPDGEIPRGNLCVPGVEDKPIIIEKETTIQVEVADIQETKPEIDYMEKISKFFSDIGTEIEESFSSTPSYSAAELEMKVHDLINSERINNGLPALKWDDKIGAIARAHSDDMVNRDFYSHENPDGLGPSERGKRAGYSCSKSLGGGWYSDGLAENIDMVPIHSNVVGCGSTHGLDNMADCMVGGWMGSPGHRENILTKTYDRTGVGVAFSEDGDIYGTQNFC